VVWHLTLSTAWLGSLGWLVGPPFVYGPLGGGAKPPWRTLPSFGVAGIAFEALRRAAQGVGRYLNPLARLSWKRARLILTQNADTRRWLPRRHRGRAVVLPHVMFESTAVQGSRTRGRTRGEGRERTALFAGRLLEWKGPALALRALTLLPGWRLVLAGRGRAERRLHPLARRLGVADRVEFRGRLPREELFRVMAEEADLLLFPSTHDEAGWVVVEASMAGLPVVCLDAGGPPVLGGRAVPPSTPTRTARALATKVLEVAGGPPASVEPFSVEARATIVAELLAREGLIPSNAGVSQETVG
jgi:glycosyltransferase involved in cell wall biosynthesis